MIRTLALYGVFGARRLPSIAAITSDQPPMLSYPLQPQHLPQWQDSCSRHQQDSHGHQAASHRSLTSLLTTLVSFQIKCIGTVSGNDTAAFQPPLGAHSLPDDSTASSLSQSSSPSEATKAFAGLPASSSRQPSRQNWHRKPRPSRQSQQAGSQVVQDMHAALRRKDYNHVKRLLDPQLAYEVLCPVPSLLHSLAYYMVWSHTASFQLPIWERGGGDCRRALVLLPSVCQQIFNIGRKRSSKDNGAADTFQNIMNDVLKDVIGRIEPLITCFPIFCWNTWDMTAGRHSACLQDVLERTEGTCCTP